MFGLSCRAHCHAVGFLLPRTLSSTCIRLGGCGDVAMVWVSSDLYSSSVFRLLTWYRPVSARSEQCGTEADMRAGAAHKRDVLPHSISGLRSIRWLAPWAPARAVVIGWAQRLGARWHSGRQLLGSEAEQNENNRNINLGACGSSATERISASTAAVWTRVSPLASPYRSVLLAYGPPSQLLPPLPALGLLQRQLPQRSRTECGPCLSPPLLPTSPLDTTGAVRDEHATIDTPSLPCVAITTSWGSVGHLFDVAMPLYLIAVSSSSRLLALARPAVQRLWQEVQCASTSVSAVWTSETEPAISDVGGPWRNINVRGIEDRPHVPDALIRVNAARPPNGPIAAPQGGAPAAAPAPAAPAAPAQAAAPRRSARIAARGAP